MRLIDVDALRKEIDSVNYYGYDPEVSRICGLINDAPIVEERPKHSWVQKIGVDPYFGVPSRLCVYCDKCGFETVLEYNFCPNCGADMRGEDDEMR